MQRSAIIFLGIAYFGFKYLPSREEKNVLVLVETKAYIILCRKSVGPSITIFQSRTGQIGEASSFT